MEIIRPYPSYPTNFYTQEEVDSKDQAILNQLTITSGDIVDQIPTLTGTGGIDTLYENGVWIIDGSSISPSGTSSSGCGCELVGAGGIEVFQDGDTWTIDGTNVGGTTSSGCQCTLSGTGNITTYFLDSIWYVDGSSIPVPETAVSGTGSINVTEQSDDFWVVENLTTYTGTGGIVVSYINNLVTIDGSGITSSGTTSSGCGCELIGAGGIEVSQEGDTWTIDGSNITSSGNSGGIDTKVQNSLVMLTWKSASEYDVFDDVFIDSYGSRQGIDPSSFVGDYNRTGEYIYKTTSGNYTYTIGFTQYGDFEQYDYKDSIVSWEQSSGNYGRFVDSTGDGVSLGIGNTASGVQRGMLVVFSDTGSIISSISGTGSIVGSVELSTAHESADVDKIVALEIKDNNEYIEVSSVTSNPSTLYENNDLYNYNSSIGGYHIRILLPSAAFSSDGEGQIRITLQGNSSSTLNADNLSIVERDGSTANGVEVPTEIFFGGLSGCSSIDDTGDTSDWLSFEIDSSKDYLLCIDISSVTVYRYHSSEPGFGYYYATATDAYDQKNFTGSFNTNWHMFVSKIETRANIIPSGTFVGATAENTTLYTNSWSSLNGIVPTENSSDGLACFYAVKFNMIPSWKVFKGSVFREIVRKQNGNWQYINNADVWIDSDINNELLAVGQAMTYSGNQMLDSEISGMSQSDWSTSGGFSSGSTYTVDLACGLVADGAGKTEFYDYVVDYSQETNNITVVTETWEAFSINPENAYCVLDIESSESYTLDADIKAFVTTNSGSNYSQIIGLSTFRSKNGHDYIRGDISSLANRSDQTMALKVTTHNNKNIKIHGVALGIP